MAWYHEYGGFPPSQAREVKGGIKSKSRRGGFGQSWWAKRWIELIESFGLGARLTRGRAYARKGQVVSIQMEKGCISAKVQGSRAKPYTVTMRVKPLEADAWATIGHALRKEALFSAALLSGQMPQQIEEIFKNAKLSLFPVKKDDFTTDCSCPDWSNPCKHIAAVYYLVAEEFDRDPFLLFRLRGIEREALLELLGTGASDAEADPDAMQEEAEPLPCDPVQFWGHHATPTELGAVMLPAVAAALPRRLGGIPFWRGSEEFMGTMVDVYGAASDAGLNCAIGLNIVGNAPQVE